MITMERKQKIEGPDGLYIELDADEIYPNDPGQGTPVLVSFPAKNISATFNCAYEQGEIEGIELDDEQQEFLEENAYAIDTWLTNYSRKSD